MSAPSGSAAQAIAAAGGVLPMLRDAQVSPTVFPVLGEFSNWRSEQRSWRETVALLDQSHHMTDLFLGGPDALRLLSDTGVNSFASFPSDSAKQFVAVNHDGHLVGDAILFHLEGGQFDLVGWHMVLDWVEHQGRTGGYDVTFDRDPSSAVRGPGTAPRLYRYELQGPRALELMERLTGAEVPPTRFFGMTTSHVAGLSVRSLRHGMAGQPGFELFGPWAEGEQVQDAILQAGADLGLVRVGSKAYSTANLESAWVPSPFPAIFTGAGAPAYLEWLPASRVGSLAGSFVSPDVEDYYLSPYDLGYGRSVRFDHDFIGREALQAADPDRARRKVTLVWDPDDVVGVQRTLLEEGLPAKYLDLPKARYGQYQVDRVLRDGVDVGLSLDVGQVTNEHAFVSLAVLSPEAAEPGTSVEVVWGEDPVSRKPSVEPHRQVRIRASVAPAPFSRFARESYRST